MNPPDRLSGGLKVKLDTALQTMCNPKVNNHLTAVNSLKDLVKTVEAQRDEQISQADANNLISAGSKGVDS